MLCSGGFQHMIVVVLYKTDYIFHYLHIIHFSFIYICTFYRMDPLLFRNVLTSASSLTSLVVKNVCSDAMLKLIGNHCPALQYLDISNSKQVKKYNIDHTIKIVS